MVAKKITRTLTRATIHGYVVKMVDGKPVPEELAPVEAWGTITEKEAVKILENVYGKECRPIVGEVTYTDEEYTISVEAFVANAEKKAI